MLTEIEKAYLAGIVDADGCISISHSKGRNASNPNHTLAVVISQADKLFLERWQEKAGLGRVYLSKRAHKKEGHLFARNRDQYLWMMSASQAEVLLSMLLPYLDIKHPQAEVALRFRQTKKEHAYSRGARLSDDILRRRDQCEREMKALNKKRKVPKSTPNNDCVDRPQQLQLQI